MAPAPRTATLHRIDRDHRAMTRHGSAQPRFESPVLPAAIPLALATTPAEPAPISRPDTGHQLRATSPLRPTFRTAHALPTGRCDPRAAERKPKNP